MPAVGAGIAISLSLPPFGWWPLGVLGLAGLAALIGGRSVGARAALGAAVGLGQFAVGLWWVTDFNAAGYGVLVVLGMAFMAAAAAAVPARRGTAALLALPAALMVAEWVRGHYPLGGLPLGGAALGQAAGPLAPAARVGGPLLVVGVTAAVGAGLALLARAVTASRPEHPRRPGAARHPGSPRRKAAGQQSPGQTESARRLERPTLDLRSAILGTVMLLAVVAVVAAGRLGPDGAGTGAHPTLRVVAVQGGGARGLHAVDSDQSAVLTRQLDATADIHGPVELVVWPEDVLQVDQPVGQSPEGATVGQMAARLSTTVVAGVVEDVGTARFRNAAVAWTPAGLIVARYDKVHRVPFGEYIPARGLIGRLVDLVLVPRDAIAGRGPGLLDTPAGRLGVVISYEVFFEDRSRSAVRAGGQVLLVPTNASSYSTTQVPAQEVAAAQLRAWETGRDVIQAAPTGYSALIDHDGRVLARSTLGRRQVVPGTVTMRDGRTWFVRLGDTPFLVLALVALLAAVGLVRHHR